jgi:hypothetical protein
MVTQQSSEAPEPHGAVDVLDNPGAQNSVTVNCQLPALCCFVWALKVGLAAHYAGSDWTLGSPAVNVILIGLSAVCSICGDGADFE